MSIYDLEKAAGDGRLSDVRKIIDEHEDSISPYDKSIAFRSAFRSGHMNLAHLLITRGADCNVIDEKEQTALMEACKAWRPSLLAVQELLSWGAAISIMIPNGEGTTPLHQIALSDDNDDNCTICRMLISKLWSDEITISLDSIVDDDGATTLHYAAKRGGRYKFIKEFLDNGANVNASDKHGLTPLHYLAMNANSCPTSADILLQNSASLDVKTEKGITPLYYAAKWNVPLAIKLIKAGADVNVKTNWGSTALHSACASPELIEALIDAGTNINEDKYYVGQLLLMACGCGMVGIVKKLVNRGLDTTKVVNERGMTPLHVAAHAGHADIIGILLAGNSSSYSCRCNRGVDCSITSSKVLSATDRRGRSSFRVSVASNNCKESSSYVGVDGRLLEHGAQIMVTDNKGNTPVGAALDGGSLEAIKVVVLASIALRRE